MVRRGTSQGSGTIIASVDGEALVLTAAHVVSTTGPIVVDLQRYNLGLERKQYPRGQWPRPVAATLAASDPAADLAILRIEGLVALPYVARVAPDRHEPAVDSVVTSIGIDLGTRLSSWSTLLVEALWFELNDCGHERLFFITARAPEHGRSGGGLFLPNGELVGVCIGHAELVRGRRRGVFASRESIRQLLADHDLTVDHRPLRADGGRASPATPPLATPRRPGRGASPAGHAHRRGLRRARGDNPAATANDRSPFPGPGTRPAAGPGQAHWPRIRDSGFKFNILIFLWISRTMRFGSPPADFGVFPGRCPCVIGPRGRGLPIPPPGGHAEQEQEEDERPAKPKMPVARWFWSR